MAGAALVGLCAARLAIGSWPDLDGALRGTSEAPLFPDARVAEATAVIVSLSPLLVRPLRRLGRWIIGLGVLGAAIVGVSTPSGAIAAVLIGIAAAAGTRLAFGTSAGRPSLEDVAAALAQLGVRSGALDVDERQVSGVFHVRGVDDDGRPLLVKVYGRDAYDTQVVATLWRTIWYRGSTLTWGRGRLHSAEREAFVTLLARNAGLATREVVTAGATIDDDALLVLRGDAPSFAALAPDRLDDALLRSAWQSLELLRELRIAHQQIDPSTIVVVGREAGFVDLGEAILAPDARQLTTDRAQLLVSTASLVGSERALRVAVDAVGAEGIAELVPYLQAAAFSTSLRRQLKAASLDVDEFREQAAAAVGIEPPEAVKLRRVTKWAVVQMALLVLAAYTIIDAASGVDWEEVRSTVADASWAWIAGGLVVAQLPRLAQAVATLGSVPVRLPLGPVYAMQLAMSYMNVALPSNLARMAVNIRFFQRQGLSAPTAVASGAIDSFASTAVQALLLALLLIFSESSLALDLPFPSGGVRTLLWLLAGALVASILILVLVRRLRDADRRPGPPLVARRSRRARRSACLAQAGAARAREPRHGAAVRDRARSLRPELRLRHLARRAARDQHQRLAARQRRARSGWGRRGGVRAHPRAHVGGHDRGAGGRRRAALPHRDLLSPAAVGLLRHAVATAQSLSLTVTRRRGARTTGCAVGRTLHDVEATVQAIPDRLQVQLGDERLPPRAEELRDRRHRPSPWPRRATRRRRRHCHTGQRGRMTRAELLDIGIGRNLEEDHLAQLGRYVFHSDRLADARPVPLDTDVSIPIGCDQPASRSPRATATASSRELAPTAWRRWRMWLRTVSRLRWSSSAI